VACPCPPRLWVEASALCWWIKDGPVRFPLVTTGDPVDPLAGALGRPGTRVLFGGSDLDYGEARGFRLAVGGWLPGSPVGAEAGAFWLDTTDVSFVAASNGLGMPALYLPSFNALAGTEGRLVVADPVAGFAGSAAVQSTSRLWGWDANALFAIAHGGEVALLAGFRYADLTEALTVSNGSRDLLLLTQTDMVDRFGTSNRFYGGQVGLRAAADYGRWSLRATAKLAVGYTHETIDASGRTTQGASTFTGAFFAQPTNIGRRTNNEFSALTELGLRAGCQVCGCLRAFAGYDWLCWTRVARPADQIDRATNPTQSPVFGAGSLAGPARPTGLIGSDSFWAQGFSAGLEFRY
jgi:hypothetical protein